MVIWSNWTEIYKLHGSKTIIVKTEFGDNVFVSITEHAIMYKTFFPKECHYVFYSKGYNGLKIPTSWVLVLSEPEVLRGLTFGTNYAFLAKMKR